MVTVRAVFHVAGVIVSTSLASPSTYSLASALAVMITSAVGWLFSLTPMAAVAPPSVTAPLKGPAVIPAVSLSILVRLMVCATVLL